MSVAVGSNVSGVNGPVASVVTVATTEMVGAVLSVTETVKLPCATLRLASVAVQLTVGAATGDAKPDAGTQPTARAGSATSPADTPHETIVVAPGASGVMFAGSTTG